MCQMKLLKQQAKSNSVHNSVTTQQSTHLSVDFAHLSHRFHIQDTPGEDHGHCFHIQTPLGKTRVIVSIYRTPLGKTMDIEDTSREGHH